MKMLIEANRYLWPDLSTRSINQRSSDKNDQNCHVPLQRRKDAHVPADGSRSEEHTSELQSLMRISYAVFCLKKKITTHIINIYKSQHTNVQKTIVISIT